MRRVIIHVLKLLDFIFFRILVARKSRADVYDRTYVPIFRKSTLWSFSPLFILRRRAEVRTYVRIHGRVRNLNFSLSEFLIILVKFWKLIWYGTVPYFLPNYCEYLGGFDQLFSSIYYWFCHIKPKLKLFYWRVADVARRLIIKG